jgi:hypothetical protein
VSKTELFLYAVLIGVHCLGADAELARDLGAAVPDRQQAQDLLLAPAQRVEPGTRGPGNCARDKSSRQQGIVRPDVDVPSGDDANRLHKLQRRRLLRQVPTGASFQERQEPFVLAVHHQDEHSNVG